MRWIYYVYEHVRPDTGEVFYVGKGKQRRSLRTFERAEASKSRNRWWRNIVAKAGGFETRIVAMCESDEEAQRVEKTRIAHYGKDNLCNLTDGGDGHAGLAVSDQTRRIRSENAKRSRSKAWVASIRKAREGGGNGGVVKHGDRLPQEWRRAISESCRGEKNPMWGRKGKQHPRARDVVSADGALYNGVREAAEATGMKYSTLYNMLSGQRKNTTNLRFRNAP
jgi:hypothetical protein